MPLGQTLPHSPQLEVSLLVFTHAPPGHWTCPAAHRASHTSSAHTSVVAHSVPFGHLVAHRPPLHTSLARHRVVQSPQ
jgi:hypothetical protein